jgi:hypothetical protein
LGGLIPLLFFGLGFALFLQALQFVQGSVKRALQTGPFGADLAQ